MKLRTFVGLVLAFSAAAADSASVAADSKPAPPQAFGSASDLWTYAEAALGSASEAQVFEAYSGARECAGLKAAWDDYASFASGGNSTITGPLTPERQGAIQALQAQCHQFLVRDKKEVQQLRRALLERMTFLGDTLMNAQARLDKNALDLESMSTLIFSGSPSAMEIGLVGIDNAWATTQRIPADDPSVQSMGLGSFFAVCDLGKDCTREGYSARLRCALQGVCLATLFEDWKTGLTASQAEEVEKDRQSVVRAVRGHDLRALWAR